MSFNNNNNNNKLDDVNISDDQTLNTFPVPGSITQPPYKPENMLKVIQALKGEYVTGAAKMHTIYPLPYLKGASIGCMACLLAGADGDNLERTPHSYHCHLTRGGGCKHMSVFNDFLQDHLETNNYVVKDGVQLPFTYESPTILDLTDDEPDHVVLASLTADIAKFQALQKIAVDKLAAFISNKLNNLKFKSGKLSIYLK